jgi:hypothetical protein
MWWGVVNYTEVPYSIHSVVLGNKGQQAERSGVWRPLCWEFRVWFLGFCMVGCFLQQINRHFRLCSIAPLFFSKMKCIRRIYLVTHPQMSVLCRKIYGLVDTECQIRDGHSPKEQEQ